MEDDPVINPSSGFAPPRPVQRLREEWGEGEGVLDAYMTMTEPPRGIPDPQRRLEFWQSRVDQSDKAVARFDEALKSSRAERRETLAGQWLRNKEDFASKRATMAGVLGALVAAPLGMAGGSALAAAAGYASAAAVCGVIGMAAGFLGAGFAAAVPYMNHLADRYLEDDLRIGRGGAELRLLRDQAGYEKVAEGLGSGQSAATP
jgi:hypothetical protein